MKTDTVIKRGRWVMAGIILFDCTITLVGQPATYWQDPATALEYNRFMQVVVSQGWLPCILLDLLYIAGTTVLVSFVPRRLGLIMMTAFGLGHYFGGSTWLAYRFGFGAEGQIIYTIMLAVVLAFVMDRRPRNVFKPSNAEQIGCTEPGHVASVPGRTPVAPGR